MCIRDRLLPSTLDHYQMEIQENMLAKYQYILSVPASAYSGNKEDVYKRQIPDCVEYGEWKTGLRNDGFQYAFISLGNKIGMAVGTALLAGLLGKYGYIANQTQNAIVLSIMKHAFTTIPGVLWIVTAVVLFFYRLNKKRYNEIVEELKNGRKS